MGNNTEQVEAAAAAFMRTHRLHRRMIEQIVNDFGIHRGQHFVLMQLDRGEQYASQREMAEALGITPAALTGTLARLESGAYIRRQSGEDGRVNVMSITPRGHEVVERSKAHFHAIDMALFDGFTDGELRSFITLMEKMQENMSHLSTEEKENGK